MNLAGVIYILGNDTEDLNQNDISERENKARERVRMRTKARGLAQHGGPFGWLEESTRQVWFFTWWPGRTACLFRTVMVADGTTSCCYVVNVHNNPTWATSRKEGMVGFSSRQMTSLWIGLKIQSQSTEGTRNLTKLKQSWKRRTLQFSFCINQKKSCEDIETIGTAQMQWMITYDSIENSSTEDGIFKKIYSRVRNQSFKRERIKKILAPRGRGQRRQLYHRLIFTAIPMKLSNSGKIFECITLYIGVTQCLP